MAGIPQPRLRRHQEGAEDAGDLRRPQSLRSGGAARAGAGVLPHWQEAVKGPDTSKGRVLVVGDVMLDRYWYGDVSRISPEAPVPVVLINEKKEDLRLGGAANVAHNCAALRASTRLLSVVGHDEAGRLLERLLKKHGVDANLHRDRSIRTTEKLRVIGRQQQLLRMDFERAPSREVLASKLTQYRAALPECDVVILSDYGKEGMTLFRAGRKLHFKTEAREVFDVTGAGDTVIAGLAVMLAAGANVEAAVRAANRAAGIVVGKLGTAVANYEELFGK